MGKATFDFIADLYPVLEELVFGSTLSQSRKFFVPRVTEGNNVLLIGEGNGRFLFEIVKQTSSSTFTVVDSSAGCWPQQHDESRLLIVVLRSSFSCGYCRMAITGSAL